MDHDDNAPMVNSADMKAKATRILIDLTKLDGQPLEYRRHIGPYPDVLFLIRDKSLEVIAAEPVMASSDQIIDAAMARSIQADAERTHPLLAWIVMRDDAYPGQILARLVTDAMTPYVLLADTLGALHAQFRLAWSVQLISRPIRPR